MARSRSVSASSWPAPMTKFRSLRAFADVSAEPQVGPGSGLHGVEITGLAPEGPLSKVAHCLECSRHVRGRLASLTAISTSTSSVRFALMATRVPSKR